MSINDKLYGRRMMNALVNCQIHRIDFATTAQLKLICLIKSDDKNNILKLNAVYSSVDFASL